MDISGESHTIGHSRCGLEYPFIFFTQNIKDGGNGALCATPLLSSYLLAVS